MKHQGTTFGTRCGRSPDRATRATEGLRSRGNVRFEVGRGRETRAERRGIAWRLGRRQVYTF